jgi:hypothetical protein
MRFLSTGYLDGNGLFYSRRHYNFHKLPRFKTPMKRALLIALLALPAVAFSQISHDSLWAPMRYFVGSWNGDGEGVLGNGKFERNYQWALNGNFIQIRNRAAYAPQAKSPQGEIHEDLGFISYDQLQKRFTLRQFHVEGTIVEYNLESVSPDGKRFVFESFEIENIPVGWRVREVYQIVSDDEYIETFEMAAPGKDFTVYSKATMKRRKPRYTG